MNRFIRTSLQAITFVHVIFMMLSFLLVTGVLYIFVRNKKRQTRIGVFLLTYYSRYGLWIFKVKVNLKNFWPGENALYVCNHLSYLDVLVIASHIRTCFVTSVEVRETPFLGQLCQMAGCLFVERRNKLNILVEIKELTEALNSKLNVSIFPEATSSNGSELLRFRKPLYFAAVEAKRPVIPLCLNYLTAAGKPITQANRDDVFWYGTMDFAPHLWRLIGTRGVTVDLIFGEPLQPTEFTELPDLVMASQKAIENVFIPIK